MKKESVKDVFWLDAETWVRVFERGVSIGQTNMSVDSRVRLTNEQIQQLYSAIQEVKREVSR